MTPPAFASGRWSMARHPSALHRMRPAQFVRMVNRSRGWIAAIGLVKVQTMVCGTTWVNKPAGGFRLMRS